MRVASWCRCCCSHLTGRLSHLPEAAWLLSARARISPVPLPPGSCPRVPGSLKESTKTAPHPPLPPNTSSQTSLNGDCKPLARARGHPVCREGLERYLRLGVCIYLFVDHPKSPYMTPGTL